MKQKSVYIIFVIFIVILTNYSCKEYCNSLCEPELAWKVPFNTEILGNSRLKPLVWENLVVFDHIPGFSNGENKFIAFDKFTGKTIWEWNNFVNPNEETSYGEGYFHDNKWIVTTGGRMYAINLIDGSTSWFSESINGGYPYLIGIENMVFHIEYGNDGEEKMMMYNTTNGLKQEVFTLPNTNGYEPNIRHFDAFRRTDGNIVIVGINSSYNIQESDVTTYFFSFNISNEEFELYTIPIRKIEKFSFNIISDSLVLIAGMQCWNYRNGERKWYFNAAGTNHLGLLYDNGGLFGIEVGGNESCYRLNPNTGEVLWDTPVSGNHSYMNLHEGILYFTGSGRLHALDAETGERIWDAESPDFRNDGDLFFDNVLTQDPETGYLYTNNYGYVLCYKPAEPR